MNRSELTVKALQLRYGDRRLKNYEVADELGLKAYEVSRLIDAAWKSGVVSIRINQEGLVSEDDFASAFNLNWVRFVETVDHYTEQKKILGEVAATEFERIVRAEPQTIALGGGDSLHQMVRSLKSRSRAITLAPLALICRSIYGRSFDGAFVTMEAASISDPSQCRARVCALPPLSPDNAEAAMQFTERLFHENSEVRAVFHEALHASAMFFGVSNYGAEPAIAEAHERVGIGKADISAMRAVGHLNFSFFDENGADVTTLLAKKKKIRISSSPSDALYPVDSKDRHPFLAAVSLDAIKRAAENKKRDVILVAAGEHKRHAISAALNAGVANAAIIDLENARQIYREKLLRFQGVGRLDKPVGP